MKSAILQRKYIIFPLLKVFAELFSKSDRTLFAELFSKSDRTLSAELFLKSDRTLSAELFQKRPYLSTKGKTADEIYNRNASLSS